MFLDSLLEWLYLKVVRSQNTERFLCSLLLQLMEKLEEFVTGDRKCFENNIRVCLSSSKCFVKVNIKNMHFPS